MFKMILSTTLCLFVCGTATAAPEVTYCFQPAFDSSCALGDSETTGTIHENLYLPIVDVTAKSNIGDPQIDNWCSVKAHFTQVGITTPYPDVGFINRTEDSGESDSHYKTVDTDRMQLEHLFYLRHFAADDSIVDGTTNETDLGELRIRGTYNSSWPNSPAPCSDGTVSLVPNETTRPMGIAETYDGETWTCGGLTWGATASEEDVSNHVIDYYIDQPTTLTVTVEADHDGDWDHNSEDNCVYVDNATQVDTNDDSYGNKCDCDFNNDGFCGVSDFGLIIAAYGCTTEVGKCTMPGWKGPACTLDPDDCVTGTCHDCYDVDIDMDSNGGIGITDWGLYLAGHGQSMEDKGLDLCE